MKSPALDIAAAALLLKTAMKLDQRLTALHLVCGELSEAPAIDTVVLDAPAAGHDLLPADGAGPRYRSG